MAPGRIPSVLPLLPALALAALVGACFSDQVPPPTFRNTCDADGDCRTDEACVNGLCEIPCTQATSSEVCPADSAGCVNGACSSLCDTEGKDLCPSPQTCTDLGIDLGGGFVGGGGDGPKLGACTSDCTASSCPDGEACVLGFCVVSCTTDDDCITGLVCQGGLCAPDFGTSSDGSGSGSGTTGTTGTTGSTGSGT